MTLAVHLMGPVRLDRDGQQIDLGGPKQQAVLAVLALSAGHRVSTDRIVALVWDDHPPDSARRTVQSYVSSLRRILGASAELAPSSNGYTLELDRASVDLLCFEDEASNVLASVGFNPDDKARRLADLLSTWETPLDGLRSLSRLDDLTAPFEELRLQAVAGLAKAQIAGTGAGDAVRTLEALVREHPTRENLWLELARGLDRLGRRDAALAALQRAREALREHLGVHPSALLIGLEAELLGDEPTASGASAGDEAGVSERSPLAQVERASRAGNLPTRLSSFIGRVDEVGEAAQLVSEARLVTLRGLGGIGKTRLALRVAAECASEFHDGVWFVDLAYAAPAADLSERFLAALGLASRSEVAPFDQLLGHLRPLRALLVVDNCEQQPDDVARLVGQLVQQAPDLHVLATSRTSLRVAGEAIWQVGPLDRSMAVTLFAERARFIRHDFELTASRRRTTELICEKLDGIPLAIELAAARVTVLSLEQILEHLGDRFELLSGQSHLGHDEERTVRSALDWSHELLDEPERSLLLQLSVFPARFTLEAVRPICAGAMPTLDLVNSMGRLVETSLIAFEVDDGDPRYRLLETVREHAAEKLSRGERRQIALRHVQYYLDLASRIAIDRETDHLGALHAVDLDLDNFRAAMSNAFTHEYPKLGLSIARHLGGYFFARQLNREFLRWLQAGIGLIDPESDEGLLAIAYALVAADNCNDTEVTDRLAEQVKNGIDLARSPAVRARLLTSHGACLIDVDPRAADEILATAADILRDIDSFAMLSCIHNRLQIAWRTGDLPGARAMAADLDSLPDRPIVRRQRLVLEIQEAACAGEWEQVIASSFEHYGLDEETSADLLHFRAEAEGALGRTSEAIATLDQLDQLDAFDDLVRSNSQILRVTTELRRGGSSVAKSLLVESAASFSRDVDRVQRTWLASLGGVAAQQLDAAETAALHFGHARAIGREFDVQLRISERPLVERAFEQCRATLGIDRFEDLVDAGESADWNDLVDSLRTVGQP